MTCCLCALPLTKARFTYASSGPFCEPCYDFFCSVRDTMLWRQQHDKAVGQGVFPWAYSLRGLKRPPSDREIDFDMEELCLSLF